MPRQPGKFAIDGMLCDSCAVAEGKLYVLGGGWDNLMSLQFPFVQARIGLALVAEIPWNETNRSHDLEIRLVAEGQAEEPVEIPIGPSTRQEDDTVVRQSTIKAQFTAGRPPHLGSGDSQKMPLAIQLDLLEIAHPGLHSFEVMIDGLEVNRLSFRAMPPPGMNLSIPGRG